MKDCYRKLTIPADSKMQRTGCQCQKYQDPAVPRRQDYWQWVPVLEDSLEGSQQGASVEETGKTYIYTI